MIFQKGSIYAFVIVSGFDIQVTLDEESLVRLWILVAY